jgi:hypothetical protein
LRIAPIGAVKKKLLGQRPSRSMRMVGNSPCGLIRKQLSCLIG